ncbi:reverse transcriptase domain-containing protein [Trichonephila clavipes]|nr:reverse transcriptase domain-containing protein [Trichonephila clavipes]
MGISDTEKNMLDSDTDYISSFENNLKFNNGMYETKLFWEDKPSDLENNWAIAKRRFGNLSIKMEDNNWLYNEYKNIVKDQIKENIVEECSSHFETNSYYMPHSAVVRKDKETTKVRMFFDASSKGRDCKSLNECLYAGPPLNPRIIDVILRFREYEHVFCSDIQGEFLTIGIAEEDRDYLRFFWFHNDGDAKSYKIMRMNRVSFGVTLSPFILAATIKFHIRKYKEDYRETYELMNTSLYVDDLFAGSSESVNKAFNLSKNAIKILEDANMNLRKFKTNSKELRKLWNENGIGDVCESGERSLKVLGIIWNLNNDTFKLDAQPLLELIKNLKNSKCCVLKTATKIFDPIGFISPFVLIIKCLMQEIWEYGLGWDEQLPTELKNKWETWCSQVCLLNDLTLERKYFPYPLDKGKDLQLHIFCDASPRVFGAAVAEWYRYRIVAGFVTSSSPIPLKTRRVGQRCTLNLSRAETSSRWCGVVVRRGRCQLRCRPRHLTMVQNYVVRRQKPSCS